MSSMVLKHASIPEVPQSAQPKVDLFRRHLCFGMFLLSSLLFTAPSLLWLIHFSSSHDFASHAMLIPPGCGVLLYQNRHRIFSAVETSILGGGTLFALGMILWLLGRSLLKGDSGDYLPLRSVSIIFVWASGFVFCYGLRAFRKAAFPWLFLLLMVPMPTVVRDKAIYLLQSGSAWLAYWLLKLLRVDVFKEGFLLRFPSLDVEVAKECSGIRSSLALLITTLVLGHFVLKSLWRKLLLVLCIVPIVILKNAIRIIVISLLTIHVDPAFLHGGLHTSGGFVFYLFGLLSFIPIMIVLRKSESRVRVQVQMQDFPEDLCEPNSIGAKTSKGQPILTDI